MPEVRGVMRLSENHHVGSMGVISWAVTAIIGVLALTSCTSNSDSSSDMSMESNSNSNSVSESQGTLSTRAEDCIIYVEARRVTLKSLEDLENAKPPKGMTREQKIAFQYEIQNQKRILLSQLFASVWPQVADPDLKSALRAVSEGDDVDANLRSVDAICP